MKYINEIIVACGIAAGAVSGCSDYTGANTEIGKYSCEKSANGTITARNRDAYVIELKREMRSQEKP